ncbi:ABC transporter ATP-binding protein [Methyloglobulus sp.]|uniref:ABC transporter ATP-binding protein n=1 Tax=Methyloglobulus sp. TaxID=2518622 RepID=UPI00398A1986
MQWETTLKDGMVNDSNAEPEITSNGIYVRLLQAKPIPLDITLNCQPGEVLALVGPSGSGKTTVLRAIAGLHRSEQGIVRCQGEVWQDSSRHLFLAPYQRTVGMVFQNYALFPHLTAIQNVQEGLAHLPKQDRSDRAKEILSRVHLKGLEDRYPNALSGGQQQRVAVARALAREPIVLLLDEPFSAVDQVTRRRLYRELAELRRTLSMPVILVTHDLEEATRLADRLCILHKGVTLQTGTPLEVAARPVSATVARLMDQQNLFVATVINHDLHAQKTLIRWRGLILEAKHQPDYAPEEKVCWMIQPANVLLHRRHRHSNGERENPLSGIVTGYTTLSEYAIAQVVCDALANIVITLTLPIHVARRNDLALGERVKISLLAEAIHLMPYERLRGDKSVNVVD